MLSLQYLNKRLKKSHIEKILANYNIKYTTMKNEIENKINVMIKTFTEDISAFLNNMEEIAEEREKLKSLEHNQNELESLREEVKEKIHEQTKLRREIELLQIENNRLKNPTNNTNQNARKKLNSSLNPYTYRQHSNTNSLTNFNSPNVRSPTKRTKAPSSLLFKSDKKEKKNLDTRIFKSPQTISSRKQFSKKITDLNVNKNKKFLKKNDKSKTNKTIFAYNSADVKTESNSNSVKGILRNKKTTINVLSKKKTTFNLPKNDTTKKDEKSKTLLNQTISSFNKFKNKPDILINNTESINTSMRKDSEYYSSSSNDSDSYSKSRITTDNEEEISIIEEEISEMNYLEEEIVSLMDQIKDFNQKNNKLNESDNYNEIKDKKDNNEIKEEDEEYNEYKSNNIEEDIKDKENKDNIEKEENKEIKENQENNEQNEKKENTENNEKKESTENNEKIENKENIENKNET